MNKLDYFKFFTVIMIITGLYILCITHIDLFIKDYNNNLTTYENTYSKYLDNNAIFDLLTYGDKFAVNKEEAESIIKNDYVIRLLAFLNKKSIEETKIDIKNLLKKGNYIYKIKYEEYDKPVIYISDPEYTLVFTEDYKYVFYSVYLGRNIYINNENTDNIYKVAEKVADKIKESPLGELYDFEVSMIRIASEYETSDIGNYYIEDYKNNIRIIYNNEFEIFKEIKIGFREKTY